MNINWIDGFKIRMSINNNEAVISANNPILKALSELRTRKGETDKII